MTDIEDADESEMTDAEKECASELMRIAQRHFPGEPQKATSALTLALASMGALAITHQHNDVDFVKEVFTTNIEDMIDSTIRGIQDGSVILSKESFFNA